MIGALMLRGKLVKIAADMRSNVKYDPAPGSQIGDGCWMRKLLVSGGWVFDSGREGGVKTDADMRSRVSFHPAYGI